MNQQIRVYGLVTVTFTWLEDNKVFVKYYYDGEELEDLKGGKGEICLIMVDRFFREPNSFNLIKYSY